MKSIFIAAIFIFISSFAMASEISFTMDDPDVTPSPLFTAKERNQKILKAFDKHGIKGALFVCGKRIDNPEGKELLRTWDKKGHLIGNHSYSHLYYNSGKMTFAVYSEDFLKNEPLLKGLNNFTKLFRFPFLKEGETEEKRDEMRKFLKDNGYRNGYVTIDASDWYVDQRMNDRLKAQPKADLGPYRDFYLKHMWSRASFYDGLAKKALGREIKHTILVHHSLLSSLFLNDLMDMFKDKGWKLISAKDAYEDPISQLEPDIVPAGESIIWALAKEKGTFNDILRYPGEDGDYEKDYMDRLGL